MSIEWRPKRHPYEPADWDENIVMAFRSFVAGKANEGQQQTVWRYLQYLTGTGDYTDLSFRPGGSDAERETAFAEGKRYVGLQLMKLNHPLILDTIIREQPRGKR